MKKTAVIIISAVLMLTLFAACSGNGGKKQSDGEVQLFHGQHFSFKKTAAGMTHPRCRRSFTFG